jgi:hypothetical protein
MKLGCKTVPEPMHVPPLSAHVDLVKLTAPTNIDYTLKSPPDGNARANDTIGNCVAVAALQTDDIRMQNLGSTRASTADQAIALYTRWTGYNPVTGQPDDGTDPSKAMTDWVVNGLNVGLQAPDAIFWTRVDQQNLGQLQLALMLSGPVQLNLNLPLAAQDTTRTWDVPAGGLSSPAGVPGGWGRHRVTFAKYVDGTFFIRTWGTDQPATPAFMLAYCDGADATLSRLWYDTTGMSPPGLSWDAVRAAMGPLGVAV